MFVISDVLAQAQSTTSATEHESSKGVSKPTEPATMTQPPSTTTKIPTEPPDVECGLVIVGGGKITYCCYSCTI